MMGRKLGQLAHGLLRTWQPEIIAALALTLLATRAAAQGDEERALDAVREEIRAIEARLSRQTTERDAELESLRRAELAAAAANKELARVRTELREQRARRDALARESAEATRRLASERAALAGQVRRSYISGREELVKLLLSQESPATLGRMLDPIADKLIVGAALIMLVHDRTIDGVSIWAAIIILCREILVSGLREFLAELKVTVHVTALAKWKTAAQMVALAVLLAGPAGDRIMPGITTAGIGLLWLAAVLTLWTGYDYLKAGIRHAMEG